MDEDHDLLSDHDPANLLPFERVLQPSAEDVQKLPHAEFTTGMDDFYTGTSLF